MKELQCRCFTFTISVSLLALDASLFFCGMSLFSRSGDACISLSTPQPRRFNFFTTLCGKMQSLEQDATYAKVRQLPNTSVSRVDRIIHRHKSRMKSWLVLLFDWIHDDSKRKSNWNWRGPQLGAEAGSCHSVTCDDSLMTEIYMIYMIFTIMTMLRVKIDLTPVSLLIAHLSLSDLFCG